jgi:phage tail sheath protein FI
MPEYLSPGVYVEEVPSAIKPIAGVSTSTAAFIGVVPDQITIVEENPNFDPTKEATTEDGKKKDGTAAAQPNSPTVTWKFPFSQDDRDAAKKAFDALCVPGARPPRAQDSKPDGMKKFRQAQAALATATGRLSSGTMAPAGQPVLCTTFNEFTRHFGTFSADPNHSNLAHGVYGFFNNGGTRCYVMRYAPGADKDHPLQPLEDPLHLTALEPIDEISLVAAPGITNVIVQNNIIDHCANMADRFAILDAPEVPQDQDPTVDNTKVVPNTDYGALYFPRIMVFDSATSLTQPDTDGEIYVGPSGHMAGIYSRVDHERGVHKAPANEVVRGALATEVQISRALQDGLNPEGINCIRVFNDTVTVWGARTIGGDFNTDTKYINVRRTLIFLRKSIDQGTGWVVFEPNDRSLWAKIVRNVSAFLTNVWRDGALFGSTPQEAFYVKCDDETNPFDERELGRVTTEIGVSIVRPAEFVIFRISQWAGPQAT